MVNTNDSAALMLFAFGPVQSFIATARRTQDLWAGSQLLSHLASVAVGAAGANGAHLHYPVRTPAGEFGGSLPNRFVAQVPLDRAIPQAVEKAMFDEWMSLANAVRSYFASLAPADGWQDQWDRQVSDWLETYWVLWAGDLTEYGSAYAQATLALDARKRVRAFGPIAEPGERCTLCGEREALHGVEQSTRAFWRELSGRPQVTSAQVRPRGRERLCALCAIKRFLQNATSVIGQERFPSTSSVAAATFKARLLNNWANSALESAVRSHLDVLSRLRGGRLPRPEPIPFLHRRAQPLGGLALELLHYDGDFLYPETFEEDRLSESLGRDLSDADKASARSAVGTLERLLEVCAELNIPSPDRHLAALALDGDHMGRLLSKARTPLDHENISRALASFAGEDVPAILERGDFAGRIVYAGGDDVLALLPAGQALKASDVIRQRFADVMHRAGYQDRHASAGIAVFHHTHPLESALREAHAAQEVAKDGHYERNAVVVRLLRRSGDARQAGLKWGYPHGPAETLEPIIAVQREMVEKRLSVRFTYAVVDEAAALMAVPDAWEAELGRLLKRHQGENLSEAEKQTIAGLAVPLAELARVAGRQDAAGWGMVELAEWLLLARFLAQGGRT
jgi:CRISPR-associated protein Cmr2